MFGGGAEFEKDGNGNLRIKRFNGVVALTVNGLESQVDIDAVKRAAQILHYTLAAFTGPSEHEVIILVRIERTEGTGAPISGTYSEITNPYSAITPPSSKILSEKQKILSEKSIILPEYLTEEEADALCQEGHRLASAIYRGVLPKPICQEIASMRSCFHMPLDAQPYFNAKAIALPVSGKSHKETEDEVQQNERELPAPNDETQDPKAQEVSHKTQQWIDFLNAHYRFRYNITMSLTTSMQRLPDRLWNRTVSSA